MPYFLMNFISPLLYFTHMFSKALLSITNFYFLDIINTVYLMSHNFIVPLFYYFYQSAGTYPKVLSLFQLFIAVNITKYLK